MPLVDQNQRRRRGTGLMALDEDASYGGYTLFAPLTGGGEVYLIDLRGAVVHQWNLPTAPDGTRGSCPTATWRTAVSSRTSRPSSRCGTSTAAGSCRRSPRTARWCASTATAISTTTPTTTATAASSTPRWSR